MTTPQEVLNSPTPSWHDEDYVMVRNMAGRFMETEIAPNYEQYEKDEIVPRSVWEKAGANGLLCASAPEEFGGGGASYAQESAIIEAISHIMASMDLASLYTRALLPPTLLNTERMNKSNVGYLD